MRTFFNEKPLKIRISEEAGPGRIDTYDVMPAVQNKKCVRQVVEQDIQCLGKHIEKIQPKHAMKQQQPHEREAHRGQIQKSPGLESEQVVAYIGDKRNYDCHQDDPDPFPVCSADPEPEPDRDNDP